MKIIAGRYTLAITAIMCGVLLLANAIMKIEFYKNLWIYSPGILVILGMEILVLNLMSTIKGSVKVELGAGNIILITGVVAVFMIGTASLDISSTLIENLYELSCYVKHKI